jgi:plasmid maintenance system antidote protein VapI
MSIIKVFRNQWEFAKFIGRNDNFVSRIIHDRQELTDKQKDQWFTALKISDKATFDYIYNEKI